MACAAAYAEITLAVWVTAQIACTLAQVIDQAGQSTPDLDDPQDLKNLAAAILPV